MKIRALPDTFTTPLTQSQQALVDERDWYALRNFRWRATWSPKTRSFYAVRSIPHPDGGKDRNGRARRTAEWIHRRILGLEFGDPREVDHKNHNTLDNRRGNLRVTTRRKNMENRSDQSRHGAGVRFDRRLKSRPFQAYVWTNGRQACLGHFATAEEARAARQRFVGGLP